MLEPPGRQVLLTANKRMSPEEVADLIQLAEARHKQRTAGNEKREPDLKWS